MALSASRGLRPRVGARLRRVRSPRNIRPPANPLYSVLRNPYSVLWPLPFHFCTGLRPICTFARLAQLLRPRLIPDSPSDSSSTLPRPFPRLSPDSSPTLSPTLPPTLPSTLSPRLFPRLFSDSSLYSALDSILDSILDSSLDPALHFTARKRVEAAFFHATLGRLVFTPSFTIVA